MRWVSEGASVWLITYVGLCCDLRSESLICWRVEAKQGNLKAVG